MTRTTTPRKTRKPSTALLALTLGVNVAFLLSLFTLGALAVMYRPLHGGAIVVAYALTAWLRNAHDNQGGTRSEDVAYYLSAVMIGLTGATAYLAWQQNPDLTLIAVLAILLGECIGIDES